PVMTAPRDIPAGSLMFRTLKIVDIYQPPCDPGGRYGGLPGSGGTPAGPALGPAPCGAGGPVSAGGSGAMPGVKSGPSGGNGPTGTVRALGGAGGNGTGAPGISGGISPGIAALGTPGVNPGPFGFGGDVTTSGAGYSGPPNGPVVK